MGSAMADLPDASSPSLILTHATPQERIRTWSQTHPKWGPALSLDDYLTREAYMTTVPLAKDGGITHWILTDSSLPPDQRPILSSCETLLKPALSCSPTRPDDYPVVVDGIAHGIGSVFTAPQFRGKGYASRMLKELGARLRSYQTSTLPTPQTTTDTATGIAPTDGIIPRRHEPLFSVLYSDIGKKFYARSGWAPFASTHLSFSPQAAANGEVAGQTNGSGPLTARKAPAASSIGYHELAELCAADEAQLRSSLPRRARERSQTCVALLPNLDAILWHLMREDFMTKHIFGRTPLIRGAVYGSAPGRRVWAVWTRGYYGGLEKMEGNTLHILRFVVEDGLKDGEDEGFLVEGVRAVLGIARAEAAEWRSADVQMWNPSGRLRGLVERSGVPFEFVERDSESIASLMWYGSEPTEELDWVLNEKFGWC